MRKLLYVLLIIILFSISGCSSLVTKPLPSDDTPKNSDLPTSSIEVITETRTKDTEHSSAQTEYESPPDSTTETTDKSKKVYHEQTSQITMPPQTEKADPVASETTASTSYPARTEPVTTEPKPPETTTSGTTTAPQESKPPAETTVGNEKPSFTQTEHDRIISEVVAYAESYKTKGYTFIWLDSMEFSWEVGYMGTPRLARDGVDGVIRILKHHIDLIVKTTTDPENGITCDHMTYKVMQIDLNGEIAFVVVYGG